MDASPNKITDYIRTRYEKEKQKAMGSHGSGDGCIENIDETEASFAGFVQLFSDKTAATLKVRRK